MSSSITSNTPPGPTPAPEGPAPGTDLHARLSWKDAFAMAMAVSGGLYVSFGATVAVVGGLSAMGLWVLAALIGWVQNSLFAEMASIFPDKPGGVPIYAHEAWRERFAPAGALASFGYWFGWSAVISIVSVTAGAIIAARWLPGTSWTMDVGVAQLSPAQLIGIALILLIMVPNLFGAQPAAWVNKIVGVLLLGSFLVFIAAPVLSGQWHAPNLTWGLGDLTADPLGTLQLALVWLYLIGWTAYGTEMCAAFLPEYRTKSDGRKALFTSGAYTFAMFLLVPLGAGGLVSQEEAASDPSGMFVTAFTRVLPDGPLTDVMLLAILAALLMGVNASMADGSRALYGAALDGLLPKQFEKTNRHGVPARAIYAAVFLNIVLIIFISNPISILVAANLGYLLAILLALAGFLLLRRDHPEYNRPFRARRFAVPLAVVLVGYTAAVLIVGALSSELSGYGGPKELAIGVCILALSLVLYVYRRRVQERLPLLHDPQPAASAKPSHTIH